MEGGNPAMHVPEAPWSCLAGVKTVPSSLKGVKRSGKGRKAKKKNTGRVGEESKKGTGSSVVQRALIWQTFWLKSVRTTTAPI